MLDKKIDEIVYEDGVAVGVRSGDEIARATTIIGDPSYFPGKVRCVGRVIRAICLLQRPIPHTDNADSVQLIIPQNQVGRRHGIIHCFMFNAQIFTLQRYLQRTMSAPRVTTWRLFPRS
jgi:Rab GDP dissociation inhibitor